MDYGTFALNIAVAVLLGVFIGLERQFRQHPAGLRTNALVCVGAALFVSVDRLFQGNASPDRIAGQVVTGIGFLGGGVILREGLNVRGLSTAATLWCAAAVGSLAGLGFLGEAACGAAAVLIIHLLLRPLVIRIDTLRKTAVEVETIYRIRVVCPSAQEGVIRTIFLRHVNAQASMMLQGLATQDTDDATKTAVVAEIFSTERNDRYMNELVSRISIEPDVSAVSWEKAR